MQVSMENLLPGAYWLEQTQRDVPSGDEWLSAAERSVVAKIRVPKRRADWLLGRWTTKRASASQLCRTPDLETLARFEVRPASSGAPQLFVDGARSPLEISISHSDGVSLCVLATVEIGCDIETVEPRSAAFVSDYFTASEQERIAIVPGEQRDLIVNLIWSAKESAMKALHEGLRLDTRSFNVTVTNLVPQASWSPIQVSHCSGQPMVGWWRFQERMVRTIVRPHSTGDPQRFELSGVELGCNSGGLPLTFTLRA